MLLVLSAMPEESSALAEAVDLPTLELSGGREIVRGRIGTQAVAVAFSRWGKVAAASTAAHLITRLQPSGVLFTGIAGALDDSLRIGDLVLANRLFHHDLDASPFFAPTEVPFLSMTGLPTDPALNDAVEHALHAIVTSRGPGSELAAPRVVRGDIATGDQVIGTRVARDRVLRLVPGALCVEMEGAAVAQVCHEFSLPFACLRMISDRADESLASEEIFKLARRSGELAVEVVRTLRS